jgi:prepilin-type processing-associated H-X9-DG protein
VVDTPAYWATWVLTFYNSELDGPLDSPPTGPLARYAFRHPGATLNAMYMDGHVRPQGHMSVTGEPIYQILWTTDQP